MNLEREAKYLTEYWFAFHEGEPRVLFRFVYVNGYGGPGERFDLTQKRWVPDDTIYWYILNGEIGYEKTTEAKALAFLGNLQI